MLPVSNYETNLAENIITVRTLRSTQYGDLCPQPELGFFFADVMLDHCQKQNVPLEIPAIFPHSETRVQLVLRGIPERLRLESETKKETRCAHIHHAQKDEN